MVYCRVCEGQYNVGEKWYVDNELDVRRRTCCFGIVPNEELRQKWFDELKSMKKRYLILKDGLKCMSPKGC